MYWLILWLSDDGGETVHNEVEDLNEKMRLVAEKLNLKGHMAGMGSQKKFIYGPTDIEVRREEKGIDRQHETEVTERLRKSSPCTDLVLYIGSSGKRREILRTRFCSR